MSPRRLVPLAAALLGGFSAQAAAAEPYPVGSPTWNAAIAAATAYWGAAPCAGEVAYAYAPLPSGVLGYAGWMRSSQAPGDPTRFSGCRVDLSSGAELGPADFCTALAHELGHLHGRVHVDDPDDLMARTLSDPLPECVAAMAPLSPPAPIATPAAMAAAPAAAARPASKRRRHAKPAGRTKPARRSTGRRSARP